jgi:glycosyltransferase involved in cell wall biosynthesis
MKCLKYSAAAVSRKYQLKIILTKDFKNIIIMIINTIEVTYMLLAVNTGKRKNAITDSYKDIINRLSQKNNIAVIVPCVCAETEFRRDFSIIIREDFSCRNKAAAVFAASYFALKIRRMVGMHKIEKLFLYFDNDWFNIFLTVFLIKKNISYYVWIHDPKLHSGEGLITKTVRRFNVRFLYKKAEKIFISWEGIKKFVSETYGIDEQKIISIKLPELQEMEFRDIKPAPFGKCKYDLIFFGRIEEYKGIDLLIDSVINLKNSGKKLQTMIAGTGSIEQNIQEKVKDLDYITFINRYVPDKELAELIAVSKIVVMPYKDATGTQAIQTANFYKKPVIAANKGCFPEYIKNGINGFIFNDYSTAGISETILKLIDNEKLYKKMQIEMSSFFKKNFTLETMTAKLEQELQYF